MPTLMRTDPACGRPIQVGLLLALTILCASLARAGDLEDLVFQTRFSETIEALFPKVDGELTLPTFPITARLEWIIDELAAGETTTLPEIQSRFSTGFNQPNLVGFFNDTLRLNYPNARIVELIGYSPTRATFLIEGDNPASDFGFINLWVGYSGSQLISFFQVSPFAGSVQFPGDQTLTLTQAADAYMGLAASNALLVARIDANGQCQAEIDREANSPRALGSIFKMWVLAALAERLDDGLSAPPAASLTTNRWARSSASATWPS